MARYADTDERAPTLAVKDPQDSVWYTVDWTDWLATAETISTTDWTVPTGITQAAVTATSKTSLIKLSGGTAGVTYKIACKATTSTAQVVERSFLVPVANR
jgi:hypothetical protein